MLIKYKQAVIICIAACFIVLVDKTATLVSLIKIESNKNAILILF